MVRFSRENSLLFSLCVQPIKGENFSVNKWWMAFLSSKVENNAVLSDLLVKVKILLDIKAT